MANKLAVLALVLAALYYLLIELPAPTFVVHDKGALLISGASSGIGLDAAIQIAAKGFTVFAGVRKESDGAAAVEECVNTHSQDKCQTFIPIILDVTKEDSIAATLSTVEKWCASSGQPLIAIVNNAGITHGGPHESVPMTAYRSVMEVNYFGVVALTKAFIPLLRQHKGRVINVSSLLGVLTTGARSVYAGSKFALEGFSDSLRKELRPLGVAVSIINPGYIATKIGDKHLERIQSTKPDPQWVELYGRYFADAEARVKSNFKSGATTQVSSDAIEDAAFNPRPRARYFVANVGSLPAWLIAFLARVTPTYLFDAMMETFAK